MRQRVVSDGGHGVSMTKIPSSAARCDRIISLIDDCLAELTHGLPVAASDGRTLPRNPSHLSPAIS